MTDQSAQNERLDDGLDHRWSDALMASGAVSAELNDAQIMNLLAVVVEGEIIPRLMLAHQKFAPSEPSLVVASGISAEEIERFATLTIAGEVDDLEDYIVGLTRQGIAEEAIYLELMAPAARKLGDFWTQDLCSFTDVTIGLGRLQTLLYRVSARHRATYETLDSVRKGLFVTPEGAQHSFGIRMVEDLFRRAGWKTLCEPDISLPELVSLVRSETFNIVGIGLSLVEQVETAGKMIVEVRAASRNKDIKIMVGGSLLANRSDLVDLLGADICAVDAREAVTIAQNVI